LVETGVQRLARWVCDVDPSKVSGRSAALLKHSVLDAIGCAILTLAEDCVQPVLAYAKSVQAAGQATLIGGGSAPVGLATLVNGTLIRAVDYNDHLAMDPNDGTKLGGHPSDHLAAILALAEWQDRSGADVVAALLASYELYGRVYKFLTADLPWDHTTAFGMSIPAAAARLLRLDHERTANAIAISAAQAAALGVVRRGQLSHSKFLASALVAERGVEAALLAAAGMTGPMTVFEDSRGICRGIFRTDDGIDSLVAPLPPLPMIDGVTIKAFPGMDTSQAVAEAAIKTAGRRKLRADEIDRVELVMNDHPMTRQQADDADRRLPTSRETADHSYYYMAAVALLDGELTTRQFAAGRWSDPEVVELMRRITIRLDPDWNTKAPGGFPCRLRVVTKDGQEIVSEVAFATGHARNKMSRAQVIDKFRRCVRGKIDDARADEIIAAVDVLGDLNSIRELTRLLGTGSKAHTGGSH
jgi:2-methylcitrate dehydratase